MTVSLAASLLDFSAKGEDFSAFSSFLIHIFIYTLLSYITIPTKIIKFKPLLQSRQVKRTPQNSINKLIIWKINPLVVCVTGVKFKSAFLYAEWALNILWELLCIWSDWKSLDKIASKTFTSNSGKLRW